MPTQLRSCPVTPSSALGGDKHSQEHLDLPSQTMSMRKEMPLYSLLTGYFFFKISMNFPSDRTQAYDRDFLCLHLNSNSLKKSNGCISHIYLK